ncbi:MAG: carbamoyl-phosphate synthase large subunit [Pseudomonadota bacterium]
MPLHRALSATVMMTTALLASPSWAQPNGVNPAMTPPPSSQWPGAEIVEGVAFQGDGSVKIEAGTGGLPVLSYWRPILFREDTDRPVAGRMDCKVVGLEGPYSEADFDPAARHDAVAEARERQGFKDMDRLSENSGSIRQLDVVGRRANPRSHYVLSYILVRDGDRLVDIRRNCTFVYGKAISRPDVHPYVARYTKLTYAFEPGDGA